MKRKILVPIDFSTASDKAFAYAHELAKVFNCTIELIHVYSVSYTNNKISGLMAEAGIMKTIRSRMDAFVNKYKEEEGGSVLVKVEVNKHVEEGAPVPYIVNKSKGDDVFLVVMGTKGKHRMGDYILGSVSSRVAIRAHSPVLLIPENVEYRPFRNILYASNFEAAKKENLREIINFANLFRAAVHFVHVNDKKERCSYEQTKDKVFNQLFQDGNPAFSINMDVVESDSVVNGLNKYADDNNIDLIVLVNRQRNFFDSIMGYSESKKMAQNLQHPLMVYHYPVNKQL